MIDFTEEELVQMIAQQDEAIEEQNTIIRKQNELISVLRSKLLTVGQRMTGVAQTIEQCKSLVPESYTQAQGKLFHAVEKLDLTWFGMKREVENLDADFSLVNAITFSVPDQLNTSVNNQANEVLEMPLNERREAVQAVSVRSIQPKDGTKEAQCQHEIDTSPEGTLWFEKTSTRCTETATIEIDGKKYCKAHAEQIAPVELAS